jgi:methyl-accepting chemotaxis protein
MKSMSIGKRLALGFGLILVLVIALSIQIRSTLIGLQGDVGMVVGETMPKLRYANEIINIVDENAGSIRNLILADDDKQIVKEVAAIASQRERIVAKYDSLQKAISSEEEKNAYEEILEARKAFVPFQEGMMRLVENKEGANARALLFGQYQEYQNNYMKAVGRLLAVEDSIAQHRGKLAEQNTAAAITMLWLASLFMVALGILIAVLITRSVVNPIRKCMDAAEAIACGNMDIHCEAKADDHSETGLLAIAMVQMTETINRMVQDAKKLSERVRHGYLLERIDLNGHQGEFRNVLAGVNNSVDSLVGFLDSVPAPALMVNTEMEIIYMNKAGAELGQTTVKALVQEKKHCYDYLCTGDCRSERCATVKAMRSQRNEIAETQARPNGLQLDIQYTGVPVKDENGKTVAGFEVINDLTAIRSVQRVATKVSAYQDGEVARMAGNLKAIAQGELNCDFAVANGDPDTRDVKEKFESLSDSLRQSVKAIQALATDVGTLSGKAVQGELNFRADSSVHQGDFRKIVQGINETLDAILAPIQETAQVLSLVADRDLTARVQGEYRGDHAKITEALNKAVDNLDNALSQVQDGAVQVSSASQQISAGSQSLAQGANEQASSLEEVSSSLEELSSMTKLNADNAGQAKVLASEADLKAQQGSEAMQRMSSAIERIKEGSDATAKIIKTIDEIAMQTNLLALNAAVEAARAGDAGRGFAVVAEEVRNLAQRSAQAAKNTADMIGESVRNADDGVKIASEVASTFTAIVASVSKVNDLIGEIAGASKEQSQGLLQVNTAVSAMDKVTQQNAANAEESASASEELSSQSEELQAMVGQFQIHAAQTVGGMPVAHPGAHAAPKLAHSHWHAGKPSPVKPHKLQKMQKVSAEEIIPLDNEDLKEF